MAEVQLSLETEPAHLFPKGRARDTEQGGGFADFATAVARSSAARGDRA